MRIPILEEISINTLDGDHLREMFAKSKVGRAPVYVDLQQLGKKRLIEVLELIEDALYELNISPLFPYPFYVVTKYDYIKSGFPLIGNVDQLPKYFPTATQRITNKEQKLLDKIDIICSQIQNQDVAQRLEDYKVSIMPQKLIKQLAKESSFLEKVKLKIEAHEHE